MLFGHPENVAASSCFPGFFRRILCKNLIDSSKVSQLSTAYDTEGMEERKSKLEGKMEAHSSPNIVARLMGLESMPEFDWMSRIPDADRCKRQGKEEVKTSSSSQEGIAPAYLLQEDDEFLLLSFDCQGYREKKRDKERRKNKGICNHKKINGDHIVRRRKRVDANVEDDYIEIMIRQKPSQFQSSYIKVNNRETEMEVSPEKQSETDSSSENSSPVSVLDRPFEEDIGFLATDSKLTKGQDQVFFHHLSLWRGNSMHIEDSLLRNLNWVSFRDWWRSDGESEEMGTEIALQILDYLVQDLAIELLYTKCISSNIASSV